MLKLLCMFEDGCLFYRLANFYREQSNLIKGDIFRVEVFVSAGFGTGVSSLCIILYTCDDSRGHVV